MNFETILTKNKLKIDSNAVERNFDVLESMRIERGFKSIKTMIYCEMHSIEPKRCRVCNEKLDVESFSKGYSLTKTWCSKSCMNSDSEVVNRRSKTMMDRYGVMNASQSETINEKRKLTFKKKYGGNSPFSSIDVVNAATNTLNEKYGGRGFASVEILENIKKTNKERFGNENAMSSSDISEKSIETKREKYNWSEKPERTDYGYPYKNDLGSEVMNLFNDKDRLAIEYDKYGACGLANILGCNYQLVLHHVNRLGIEKPKPKCIGGSTEVFMRSIFDEFGIPYLTNTRPKFLDRKEIDFFFESKKLAVEINGNYWHSFNPLATHIGNIDKKLHQTKHLVCLENGIKLIQFTDDEIYNKKDICVSMVKNSLGLNKKIYARKTVIKELTNKEAFSFCENNHLAGAVKSSISFGLFYENELVQVMTFSRTRFEDYDNGYEILRLCSKIGISVVGGASRLLKHFIDKFSPDIIVSYSDNRVGSGNVYLSLGFECMGLTSIGYEWFVNGVRQSRFKYQKHKLKSLENYIDTKTEDQIMFENGHRKLYNAGNRKWVLTLHK